MKHRYINRVLTLVIVFAILLIVKIRIPNLLTKARVMVQTISDIGKPMTSDYVLDYLPEDVAMQLPTCNDHKLAADVDKSKLSLQDNAKRVYELGETIYVSIKLYDGYGQPLDKGGAILRARMFNLKLQAYATAQMTDHENGSYTAMFEASWTGTSTIKVKIMYTPETIKAMYDIRQKLPGAIEIGGIFSVGAIKEKTFCNPKWESLKHWNYSLICNVTAINSGMPWYCGKPSNEHLLCEDLTDSNYYIPKLPFSPCEKILNSRIGQDISHTLEVHVTAENQSPDTTLSTPQTPCKDYKVASLWTRKRPTGFMYNNTWRLRHCKGPESRELFSCLKDIKVLFLGDSTIRQWYEHAVRKWECVQITEKWPTTSKPHKPSACENSAHNFTVQWKPHNQPFIVYGPIRYSTASIARHIEEIGDNENAMVVVGLFVHCIAYHQSVFRRKIQIIRSSVERLLLRNPFAKVYVKGPHTYFKRNIERFGDYYGLVYRHILFDEFKGLHEKVVFLDNSDISNAMAVKLIHPPDTVVGEMVYQMLAYMC